MFLSRLLLFPTAAQESAAPRNGDLPALNPAAPTQRCHICRREKQSVVLMSQK